MSVIHIMNRYHLVDNFNIEWEDTPGHTKETFLQISHERKVLKDRF